MYPIKDQKLQTIMRVLEEYYFVDVNRIPDEILTDCGGQFLSGHWRSFARRMGFKVRRTSPYNPQSNPVERVMRELGRSLRAYACDDHRRWDEIVPRVEQVLNATEHSSTGVPPAWLEDRQVDLVIGPPQILRSQVVPRVDRDRLKESATEQLRVMARKRRQQAEKHGTATPYKEGDLVWIKSHRDPSEYEVHPNAYNIERLSTELVGQFNTRQLRPHREPAWRDREVNRDQPSQGPSTTTEDTESRDSTEQETAYEQEHSTPPSTSPRRRRKRPPRLSSFARMLSPDTDDSCEMWIKPSRTSKLEYELESPPDSDETWIVMRLPKDDCKRKKRNGGSATPTFKMNYDKQRKRYDSLKREIEEKRKKIEELEKTKEQRLQKKIAKIERILNECNERIKKLENTSSSEDVEKQQNPKPGPSRSRDKDNKPRETSRSSLKSTSSQRKAEKPPSPEGQPWVFSDPEYTQNEDRRTSNTSRKTRSSSEKYQIYKTGQSRLFKRDSSEKENRSPTPATSTEKHTKEPRVSLERLGKTKAQIQKRLQETESDSPPSKRKHHHHDKHSRKTTESHRDDMHTRRTTESHKDDRHSRRTIKPYSDDRHSRKTSESNRDTKSSKTKQSRGKSLSTLQKEREKHRKYMKKFANQRYRQKVKEKLEAANIILARQSQANSSEAGSTDETTANTPSGGSVQQAHAAKGWRPEAESANRSQANSSGAGKSGRPSIVESKATNIKMRLSYNQPGTAAGDEDGYNLTRPTSHQEQQTEPDPGDQPDSERTTLEQSSGNPDQEGPDQGEPDQGRPDPESQGRDQQNSEKEEAVQDGDPSKARKVDP
ncbi:nuclear speckle splicing regulatory protein 1-like [Harpegnathos saltator]|uniref:nuclear speckle splicing regulatory protein 1-like n=1 Tax=Harpegnathos saltator TaxID=610380 RepID=UPI000948FE6E|nr:nuclear speckle splicing regulatory protein 1-like [Harpegnathos saltator]